MNQGALCSVFQEALDVEIGGHGLLDLRQEFAEFDRWWRW